MDNPQPYQPLSAALHPLTTSSHSSMSYQHKPGVPEINHHREEEEEEEEGDEDDDEGLVEEQLHDIQQDSDQPSPKIPHAK
jgi:hypothetical protein